MAKVKKTVKEERPKFKTILVSESTHKKIKAFAKEEGITLHKALGLVMIEIMRIGKNKRTKK